MLKDPSNKLLVIYRQELSKYCHQEMRSLISVTVTSHGQMTSWRMTQTKLYVTGLLLILIQIGGQILHSNKITGFLLRVVELYLKCFKTLIWSWINFI